MSVVWLLFCGHEVMTVMGAFFEKKRNEKLLVKKTKYCHEMARL